MPDLTGSRNVLVRTHFNHSNLAGLLELLILSNTGIASLPQDIHKWKKLKTLILVENDIPPKEQERIRKALPDCDIRF